MPDQTITVILNSGAGKDEKDKLITNLKESLDQLKTSYQIHEVDFSEYEKVIEEAKATNSLIVAAGGDGTINTVAALCYKHKVKMGIIPLGTFNYFARDLQIPTDIPGAVKVLSSNKTRKAAIGFIGERIFLNNASFGLYTKIINNREETTKRFGRIRIIAAISGIISLFKPHKIFTIIITSDGKEEIHRTSMVFVGNNTLQLEKLGMDIATCTSKDKLGVVIMKRLNRLQLAWLIILGIFKSLRNESKLDTFCADSFKVESKRKEINLVIDGEIIKCATPINFRVEKNALEVVVPDEVKP